MARPITQARPSMFRDDKGNWQMKTYNAATKRVDVKALKTKDETVAAAALEVEQRAFDMNAVTNLDVTVGIVMEDYLTKLAALKQASLKRATSFVRTRIIPDIGGVTVREILDVTKPVNPLQDFINRTLVGDVKTLYAMPNKASDVLSMGTVIGLKNVLVSAFIHASKTGRLHKSLRMPQFEEMIQPEPTPKAWKFGNRILVLKQAATYTTEAEGMPAWEHLAIWIGIFTGARPSDVRRLEPSMIDDMGEKGLYFNFKPLKKYDNKLVKRKSCKRRGAVPVQHPTFVALIRRALKAHSPKHQFLLGAEPPSKSALTHLVQSILKAIQKEHNVTLTGSPHSMRHTFVTHQRYARSSFEDIALWTGDTVAMLERVYSDLKAIDTMTGADTFDDQLLETSTPAPERPALRLVAGGR